MHGRRNPFVAREGLPWVLLMAVIAVMILRYGNPAFVLLPILLTVVLYLVFRDPHRSVPSVALGVFSPVDGEVITVEELERGDSGAAAIRVVIAVDSFGTYTARAPVEGTIRELARKAFWLQTDEGDDVVLKFDGYRLGLAPRAFKRFGERLGQGQRCAYLRLARFAEVQFPANGRALVEAGQRLRAGTDLIGNLPKPK